VLNEFSIQFDDCQLSASSPLFELLNNSETWDTAKASHEPTFIRAAIRVVRSITSPTLHMIISAGLNVEPGRIPTATHEVTALEQFDSGLGASDAASNAELHDLPRAFVKLLDVPAT
jgi:hypothetical protein